MKKNIVIVGGGFAGVRAALDLAKNNHKIANCRIVVIDKESFHAFTPWLYERATTGVRAGSIKIPFSKIFQSKNIEVIKGEAVKVNQQKNEIVLKSGQVIPYVALILAYGSKTSSFGIKGVSKHALTLKTYDDAELIRKTIHSRFKEFVADKNRGDIFEIVVGGGGFTGVEFAAELHNFMKDLATKWERDDGSFEIKIIESGGGLLKSGGVWASRQIHRRLGEYRRIVPIIQSRIASVESGRLTLTNGDVDNFDILIWTVGVEAGDLSKKSGLAVSPPKSRIKTDLTLRQGKVKNIFAVGDCAEVVNKETGDVSREVIIDAYRQGALAAKNVIHLLNDRSLEKFEHKDHGFVVPIRGKWGVSTILGLRATGRLAWYISRAVHLRYFLSILPFGEAIKRWRS